MEQIDDRLRRIANNRTKTRIVERLTAYFQSARPVLLICSALLVGHCQAQIDWITYRGEQGAGFTRNALYPPLGLRWKLKLQETKTQEEKAKSFNPPVFIGENIYFGSDDGNFYSLDVNSGYMNWIFKTHAAVNSVPFADDKQVYFGSNDGHVYAVNREDGDKVWSFYTGHTVQSLVLRYEDNIIFTSDTGATFFLSPEGKEKHRIKNPVWSHHTFQVYDGVVYWAPRGRAFGAYDIKERRFLWDVQVNVPYAVWYSFPALDEENIYYASSFYTGGPVQLHYYALNRKTGRSLWKFEERLQLDPAVTPVDRDTAFLRHVKLLDYMAPSLWQNLVIYTSGDRVVRAFYADSGELAWEKKFAYPTSSAPTVAGDRVYFGLFGDEISPDEHEPALICLSARDGAFLWEMQTEGAVLNAPVISGNRMLFGTSRNQFYVLEEIF